MVLDLLKTSAHLALHPSDAIKFKDKANLKDILILYTISNVFGVVFMELGKILHALIPTPVSPVSFSIFETVLLALNGVMSSIMIYFAAKAFGGKATFTQQLYLTMLAITSGSILIAAGVIIPYIGLIFALLSYYIIYVQIIVVSDVHKISKLDALIAIIVSAIVVLIIDVGLTLLIHPSFFSDLAARVVLKPGT